MEQGLTNELQDFITRHIVSVEKLEVLILLSEAPEKFWTPDDVFRKIQSNPASIQQRLKELEAEGFLVRDKEAGLTYQYSPKNEELAQGTRAVVAAYRERPIKVIEAIFSKSSDQIRRFAEAFRIRKEKS